MGWGGMRWDEVCVVVGRLVRKKGGRGEARVWVNVGGESVRGGVAGRHGALRVK